MIRRDLDANAASTKWMLISQVAHARLAGELARSWTKPLIVWPEVNGELLETIEHHDDGWSEWEQSPRVDPRSGRPLQFLEMPLDQALEIWQRSIEHCRQIGDLAVWLVSGHFSALLRHTNTWQRSSHPHSTMAADFLHRQDTQRIGWFRAWQQRDPRRNALAVAEQALRWLQFFDALSLWFCCRAHHVAERLNCVEPSEIELRPLDASTIAVTPWVFGAAEVRCSATGQVLPARVYHDDELRDLLHDEVTLSWRLIPG